MLGLVRSLAPAWLLAATAAAALAGCGAAPGAPAAGAAAPPATPVSFPTAAGAPTTFTEPTQTAYTLSVPQGWTSKGGVQQTSPVQLQPWFSTTSPDGATMVLIGDPSLPFFVTPSNAHAQGTSFLAAPGLTALVAPYETGVQFAQDYATRAFGQSCQALTPTGSQASEPALVQLAQAEATKQNQMVGLPTTGQFSGGSMTFTCQSGGTSVAVGVMAVTVYNANAGGASWGVSLLVAYRTPPASQAQTDQTARAMASSFQHTTQWDQQQANVARQELAQIQQNGQAAQAALTQQEGAESAALQAQGQAEQAQLNANHQAGMDALNAQGQAEQQNFATQQYNQDTQQQAEMRYIGNQQCVQWADAAHTRCAVTAPN